MEPSQAHLRDRASPASYYYAGVPAKAIRRLRASPIPHGITTVAGQSGEGISSGGMILTTNPPALTACSAAILVAGLPHPLTTVMPNRAKRAPAWPAN